MLSSETAEEQERRGADKKERERLRRKEQEKRKKREPKARVSPMGDATREQVMDAIAEVTGTRPANAESRKPGVWLLTFRSQRPIQTLLTYNGKARRENNAALKVSKFDEKLDVADLFDHVEYKFNTRAKQEAEGRYAKPRRNTQTINKHTEAQDSSDEEGKEEQRPSTPQTDRGNGPSKAWTRPVRSRARSSPPGGGESGAPRPRRRQPQRRSRRPSSSLPPQVEMGMRIIHSNPPHGQVSKTMLTEAQWGDEPPQMQM